MFYIGVKIVQAWREDRKGAAGYTIEGSDGYNSWSPKAVFEAAYFPTGEANPDKVTPEMVEAFAALGIPNQDSPSHIQHGLGFVLAWGNRGLLPGLVDTGSPGSPAALEVAAETPHDEDLPDTIPQSTQPHPRSLRTWGRYHGRATLD